MVEAIAYSTLAMTVTLAVSRPRVAFRGLRELRFTPGSAALAGVSVLIAARLLAPHDLVTSAAIQWRPLLSLACIMVMTGVVQEVGAFDRLAQWIEMRAHGASAVRAFTMIFAASVVTPSLLNNDSAILLLTPLVVPLARRLYPARPGLVEAFAFAVFLAPGVAPLVVSNPMNMIVAEFAGVSFHAYARVMAPIALVGAAITYVVLRFAFRRELAVGASDAAPVTMRSPHRAEKPAIALLLAVFAAYPIVATFGGAIWTVALAGAIGSLLLARVQRVAPTKRLLAHVSPDILVFLWGVFLVVAGLRNVGLVDRVAALYDSAPAGSAHQIGTVGVVAAIGSAIVDNHPMSIVNMMALGARGGSKALLAALVGGDIGPRLLPIGSLAGLLWTDLLRREGIEIPVLRFAKLGALVLLPTLAASLAMLWLL